MDFQETEAIIFLMEEIGGRQQAEAETAAALGAPVLDATVDDLLAVARMELDLMAGRGQEWEIMSSVVETARYMRAEVVEMGTRLRRRLVWQHLPDDELEHRLLVAGVTREAARYAVENRHIAKTAIVIDRWLDGH